MADQVENHVVVTNVDISFWNMVQLLVKLTFAVIPAAIIIALVVAFAAGLVKGLTH
jgi:hypothetical protein